jgi:hypothetical protein
MTGEARRIDYEGRRFTRSDLPHAPIALWRQQGEIVTGSFSGADIVHGKLCGRVEDDGCVHFGYCMVDVQGRVISGECRSRASVDEAGLVHLEETWTRFCPEFAQGVSWLKEIRDE